jgi:hypothetical protein
LNDLERGRPNPDKRKKCSRKNQSKDWRETKQLPRKEKPLTKG